MDQFGWGDCQVVDIRAVLWSVVQEFQKAGVEVKETICVYPSDLGHPRALTERGPKGEHSVLLSARDRKYNKYVYQFSHEYCHLFTGHFKTAGDHRARWLDEVLCETASLWCLKQLSDTWTNDPPYDAWRAYAPNFDSYADRMMADSPQIKPEVEFKEWFEKEIESMQNNSTLRDKNMMVSKQLLPLFLSQPETWCCTQEINDTNDTNLSCASQLMA